MTKEELEKEAEEYAEENQIYVGEYCSYNHLVKAYLVSAEPREKQIADLEKELADAKKVQVVEHFEAYGQCRDSRKITELEQENAELKDYAIQLKTETARRDTELTKQLLELDKERIKAKELLRDFLSVAIDYIDKEDKNYSFIVEAKQFLKENEK